MRKKNQCLISVGIIASHLISRKSWWGVKYGWNSYRYGFFELNIDVLNQSLPTCQFTTWPKKMGWQSSSLVTLSKGRWWPPTCGDQKVTLDYLELSMDHWGSLKVAKDFMLIPRLHVSPFFVESLALSFHHQHHSHLINTQKLGWKLNHKKQLMVYIDDVPFSII